MRPEVLESRSRITLVRTHHDSKAEAIEIGDELALSSSLCTMVYRETATGERGYGQRLPEDIVLLRAHLGLHTAGQGAE